MTVSVVIPLYNKVRHVKRAVDSVLAQSFRDFELVLIDDGSTDGGAETIKGITDTRIRLIVQENSGECAARNRGLLEARYDLIAFLDADDEWLPGFLETVTDLYERYPEAGMFATSFLYSDGITVWQPRMKDCGASRQGGILPDFFRTAAWNTPVSSSSVMVPRSVFDRVGVFPVGVTRGGDRHQWTRIALAYPVAWSPTDGAVYHVSAENRVSDDIRIGSDVPEAPIILDFLSSGTKAPSPSRSIEEYLVSRRLTYALEHYLAGDRQSARALVAMTKGATRFRWERLRLQVALLVPSRLSPPIRRMRATLRAGVSRWLRQTRRSTKQID